jgi:signal transduction histidine kinase
MLAAYVLVVLTGTITAWVVALAVGPPLFREHLARAGVGDEGGEVEHAERAFASATGIALALALTAALAAAIGVSIVVTRRIGRSLTAVADAAAAVAAGRQDARVPAAGLGAEFDGLTASFNEMADRLARVEITRRRLLADLAHELRTPTATLDGYLEAAQDGVQDLDQPTVAMLRGQTHRLARLAQDIAAVSAAEEHALRRRPARLGALVSTVVDAQRRAAAERGVTLTADAPDDLPTAEVDPDRLSQVLVNLLDNALRHTPPGGSVAVTARPCPGAVTITVTDTGEGIDAAHLPHLFERFYRADPARDRGNGGSGIGLAIARSIVEAHGGTITAASRGPGAGSTFRIQIPAA